MPPSLQGKSTPPAITVTWKIQFLFKRTKSIISSIQGKIKHAICSSLNFFFLYKFKSCILLTHCLFTCFLHELKQFYLFPPSGLSSLLCLGLSFYLLAFSTLEECLECLYWMLSHIYFTNLKKIRNNGLNPGIMRYLWYFSFNLFIKDKYIRKDCVLK